MSRSDYHTVAERFAATLVVQAAWPAAIVVAAAIAAPFAGRAALAPLPLVAATMAVLAGLATLALSAIILLDALLFRLIASHTDEMHATATVDDLLARMRLKPAPLRNRPLAERIAGTRRLLVKQRSAAGVFVAAFAIAVLASLQAAG